MTGPSLFDGLVPIFSQKMRPVESEMSMPSGAGKADTNCLYLPCACVEAKDLSVGHGGLDSIEISSKFHIQEVDGCGSWLCSILGCGRVETALAALQAQLPFADIMFPEKVHCLAAVKTAFLGVVVFNEGHRVEAYMVHELAKEHLRLEHVLPKLANLLRVAHTLRKNDKNLALDCSPEPVENKPAE